jgi:divalent metal cation (Fe/Co/Zn/Cd) transporter
MLLPERLLCAGQVLSRVTLGYNAAEGIAALAAGTVAGSIALVGFGIDSVIEVASSVTALWRVRSDADHEEDATQTDLCAYLSAIVLGGLLLNAMFGWWWADPVAALAMAPIIAKEGLEAIGGKERCDQC